MSLTWWISQHTPSEHPALLQRALKGHGVEVKIWRTYLDPTAPKKEHIQGLISLGGPMGVHDEQSHQWIVSEMKLQEALLREDRPILGFCLGGQLLARSLGSKVTKNPLPEVGWHPIRLLNAALKDPLLKSLEPEPLVLHWHYDTFEIPKSATCLAESLACPNQAFRYGNQYYGFQFHPEADRQLLEEWTNDPETQEELQILLETGENHYVQSQVTIRELSARGEVSHVQLISSLLPLILREPYAPVSQRFRETLNELKRSQRMVNVELRRPKASVEAPVSLRGTIEFIYETSQADFLALRDPSRALWPIRLDYILSLEE